MQMIDVTLFYSEEEKFILTAKNNVHLNEHYTKFMCNFTTNGRLDIFKRKVVIVCLKDVNKSNFTDISTH